MTKEIQTVCKEYRMHILRITLEEMSEKTGVKVTTISAFENLRSNNINHLKLYKQVSTTLQFNQLLDLINRAMKWI